jgi:hypothetical protein
VAEASAFIAPLLIRLGFLIGAYEHQNTDISESMVAAVFVIGSALTWAHARAVPRERPGSY